MQELACLNQHQVARMLRFQFGCNGCRRIGLAETNLDASKGAD